MLVSVVIPVFNPGPYLRSCLDSVLNQKLADIEVICVEDGSTDGSDGVLHEYATRDARVKVVEGPRQGPGMARNRGIGLSQGKFIAFVDSDDVVTPDIWTRTTTLADSLSLDMVLFNVVEEWGDTGEVRKNRWAELDFPASCFQQAFTWRDMGCNPFAVCCYPPGRLVRREFWGDLRFPPLYIGEDAVAHAALVMAARRIGALRDRLYVYRRRTDSVTMAHPERVFDHLKVADLVYGLWQNASCRDELADYFYEYVGRLLLQVLRLLPSEESRLKIRDWAVQSFLRNARGRFARQTAALFSTRPGWLFRFRRRLYERVLAVRMGRIPG